MLSEFIIKKSPKQLEAKVFLGKEEIAEIKQGEGLSFKLTRHKDKMEWILTNLVHGEHRPFSFSVRQPGKKAPDLILTATTLQMKYLLYVTSCSNMLGNFTCSQVIQRINLGTNMLIVQSSISVG